MNEICYSRQLKGYEGTYFEVNKKKSMFSKPYYIFNLYVGGKHKLKNVLDYKTSEYSLQYANKTIQIYNSLFSILEYPLVIHLTENIKNELKGFMNSRLFSDVFRCYNVNCDFKRTNQGYSLYEEIIDGQLKYLCKIQMDGYRTLIQCRNSYYDEKLGEVKINLNEYFSKTIGEFILSILKWVYYYYFFFIKKEDKYFSYPISEDILFKFSYRDFDLAADYIFMRFFNEKMNCSPRDSKYDKLPLINYPFKISIER